MHAIAKSDMAFANRVLTTSPDVTTSTNLTGFLNLRGVFGFKSSEDSSKKLKVMSLNKWTVGPQGQHVELGIAEHNLFLMLAVSYFLLTY
jgi:pyruvate dehydrogenase E1 component